VRNARGVALRRIPCRGELPDEEALMAALDFDRVRCVAVSWVQFSSGYRVDLERIGTACRERGIWFVVDAIQGLGALALDVQRVPIGQFVDRAPAPRQEGDVLIVPCIEEVVVVEKRLRVREELRIRIVREQRTHRQTVLVRRHELDTKAPDEPVAAISNKPKGDAS
jgi:cysteine sulfinate desulfinase/cysteine desulfurase-like protein